MTQIEQITYLRVKRPATLKQFVIRKAMSEAAANTKDIVGVVRDKDTGNILPKSASIMKNAITGITSNKLLEKHPEWVEDYKKYIDDWGKENS